MTMFHDVGAFHAKFGLPHTDGDEHKLMTEANYRWRLNFLFEETREFIEGWAESNIIECADALADIIWVALGTAHYMNVEIEVRDRDLRYDSLPQHLTYSEYNRDVGDIFKEIRRFIEGHARKDISTCADALTMIIAICFTAADTMRIPIDRVWAEVRRSNMAKRPWQEGDPVKPRAMSVSGEIVKPAGWTPPDVHGALFSKAEAS